MHTHLDEHVGFVGLVVGAAHHVKGADGAQQALKLGALLLPALIVR